MQYINEQTSILEDLINTLVPLDLKSILIDLQSHSNKNKEYIDLISKEIKKLNENKSINSLHIQKDHLNRE